MQRPRKALAFFAILLVLVGGTAALSTYKVAVANAYLRLRPLAAWAEPRPKVGPLSDAAARGAHLVQVMGCADCHGQDLAGRALAADTRYLVLSAPNLTPHPTSHVAQWSDTRWHKALRLGLDDEWRMLWCMPRAGLMHLADADVEALVAHLRALPPVARTLPQSRLGWRGYVDVALRRLRLLERTPPDPALWRPLPPAAGADDLADYLLAIGSCQICHTGQQPKTWRPQATVAPRLVELAHTLADFASWDARLRHGRCPGDVAGANAKDVASGAQPAPGSRLADFDVSESQALWTRLRAPVAP